VLVRSWRPPPIERVGLASPTARCTTNSSMRGLQGLAQLSENCVQKLSERGRRSLQCSPTEHRNGPFRPILASLRIPNPRSNCCSYPISDSFSTTLVNKGRKKGPAQETAPVLIVLRCPGRTRCRYSQRSLSLLVSNLSSTSSKASGPTWAAPEKGWSMAPMVNKTSAITPASDPTISACATVFCKPKR
jgi:hypothetical protein